MDNDTWLSSLLNHLEDNDYHDPHDRFVRQIVRLRARDACEYCLQPTIGQFQVDHVIPSALWHDYAAGHLEEVSPSAINRRGPHHLDNFAWSCVFCNLGKRQQVTYRVGTHTLRLFDPRRDLWTEHFTFTNSYLFILGITPVGVATQYALGFNSGEIGGPLGTRHDAILSGRYPPSWYR